MTVPVRDLLADPAWLPHRLTPDGDGLGFVKLSRDDHRSVTFLDDQYFQDRFPVETVSLSTLAAEVDLTSPVSGLDFVFHSSMALSTLAARLFDIEGVSMGLKEPVLLNQLADIGRHGRLDRRLVTLALRLLARPLASGERVVIKAGNVANRLIPEMMAVAPAARALILYAPLDDFLRSIARKGTPGRIAYRRLFLLLRGDHGIDGGFSDRELFEQTDLQITALAWLNHHAQFAQLLPALAARVRTMSSRAFLADRDAAIAALAQFMELPVDPIDWAASPVFSQHSKELGRVYDAAMRATDYATVDAAYGSEIAMVAKWGETVAQHGGIPLTLGNRLIA